MRGLPAARVGEPPRANIEEESMHGTTRRRAFKGAAAFLSLLVVAGAFAASAAISVAQTDGDHDKAAISKVRVAGTVNAGDVVTFKITITTQPLQIDGVGITDVLAT